MTNDQDKYAFSGDEDDPTGRSILGGEVVQCCLCKHYDGRLACTAFPAGIPRNIWSGWSDHRLPYSGDGGIMFEPNNAIEGLDIEKVMGVEPGKKARENRERAIRLHEALHGATELPDPE